MAADAYSVILGLLEQGTGNNNNTWGSLLNTGVMDQVDKAIAGINTQIVTGGTLDLSGSPPPAGPSGAIHAIHSFTGVLASNQIIKIPNLSKIWLVNNQTTGAFTLTYKTPSGSASTAVPQGVWTLVWCDGADNVHVGIATGSSVSFIGPDGTVAAPAFSFAAETGSGIYRKASQTIGVAINGSEIFEINASGVNVTSGALTVGGAGILPSGTIIDYTGLTEPTGWYFPAGQTKSRSTDAALLAAIAPNAIGGVTITGNTHTNTTLDNLSVDLRGLGLVGAFVEGTGITTGTTIASINSATSLTLSLAATGTATGITIRVLPYGQGDGSTTFTLPDYRGRSGFGRDDMTNSAAGRITVNAGTKLVTVGGAETHVLSSAEVPSHVHAVFINDPGHAHAYQNADSPSATASAGSQPIGQQTEATQGALTGITVRDAPFGNVNQTAISGGGGAHTNMPTFLICNKLIKR